LITIFVTLVFCRW